MQRAPGAAHCAVGNRITPITVEGLKTVRAQLRATATRQTAVACYTTTTTGKKLELVWAVGSKGAFSPSGLVPVATKMAATKAAELPAGLRIAASLAKSAGFCHDFGKFGDMFSGKLGRALTHSRPESDPVRHEWISQKVLFEAIKENSKTGSLDFLERDWDALWASKINVADYKKLRKDPRLQLEKGLTSPMAAFFFLVFTHHHLPNDGSKGPSRNTLSDGRYIHDDFDRSKIVQKVGTPQKETWTLINNSLRRLEKMPEASPLFWRAAASIARMALILADHSVSSIKYAGKMPTSGTVFANTRDDDSGKKKIYNQPLDWHLTEVGVLASKMLHLMWNFSPPALSVQARKQIAKPSEGFFSWQTTCAQELRKAQAVAKMPTLLFNIAGTGAGKTRMNVVALDALRQGEDLRIAACFNLRTLTTQTHDAYVQQLKISADECALVIGGSSIPPGKIIEDEDGNEDEDEFDVAGECDPPPEFLSKFLHQSPKLAPVIMSPIVVATVDHMVKAGDPNQKANHALTNLRMMKSDLVIDEIDSFDPRALVCVVKLVTAAAMWGRNVVVSSATMSEPVAKTLRDAFDLGIRMAFEMGIVETPRWRASVIDNHRGLHTLEGEDFTPWFKNQLQGLMAVLAQQPVYRPVELIRMQERPKNARKHFQETIAGAVKTMHTRHRQTVLVNDAEHKISFGLVRVANIGTAVRVAEHLCQLPNARVACYHSNLNRLHRQLLEQVLDAALNRNGDQEEWRKRILAIPEIRSAIEKSIANGATETSFVVVATPVEEIGRDHDFDYAVLEPSSAQSLVQASGRVNRHRQGIPDGPNVAILQFNLRHLVNLERGKPDFCFVWPGFESDMGDVVSSHPMHDLSKLFDWDALAQNGVDARMRYDTQKHPFPRFDDDATHRQIHKSFQHFLKTDSDAWYGADTYHRLREGSPTELWSVDENGGHVREERFSERSKMRRFEPRPNMIASTPETPNAWLAWPLAELMAMAQGDKKAMSVQLRSIGDTPKNPFVRHGSFGYHRED